MKFYEVLWNPLLIDDSGLELYEILKTDYREQRKKYQ